MRVDSGEEQRLISFCTGYGGLELGLEQAGLSFRTVCYVEIEAFACGNLVKKIEKGRMDAAPVWTDIKTFPAESFSGKVHGIIGGYPCQPFSNAGKRQGTKDPRHLWPYILEHVRTIRPVWCFFENVAGHLSLGFEEVAQSLRGLGYKVEAGLFTAAEVGAPHKRERLFILAYARCNQQRRISGNSQEKDGIAQGTRQADRRDPKLESRSQELGNSSGGRSDTRGERTRRKTRSNIGRAGSGSELGNPKGLRSQGQSAQRRKEVEPDRTNEELGNPDGQHWWPQPKGRNNNAETRSTGQKLANADAGQSGPTTITESGKTEQPESGNDIGKRAELADSDRAGCEEQCGSKPVRQEYTAVECGGCRWPARPGQEQYEWEEPRTVESGMGRAVNGFASRVDELRLLGNGVVPQQAAKAFRYLWEKSVVKSV